MTPTGRVGRNVGAGRSHRLAVHEPRLLPMDTAREQRAVAAFTALFIPIARDGHIAGPDALDSTGRIEQCLVHGDQ